MRRAWLAAATILIAALGISMAPGKALAQMSPWKKMADAPEGEEEVYGTASGGKVYLMGGIAPGWKPLGIVAEYDPVSNKWAKKKHMPQLIHHVGVAEANGKIYLMGGFLLPQGRPAWTPVNSAWEYDPKTDGWKKLAGLPKPLGSPACAALEGKIYCTGGVRLPDGSKENGIRPGQPLEQPVDLLVYDIASNKWSKKAPMITPRNHFALNAVGGKLYAIGGRVGGPFVSGWSVPVGANEMYDPAADTWSVKRPMITPRSSIVGVAVNGRIHVMGGEEWKGTFIGVHKTHESYDPKTNSWRTETPLLTPRHGFLGAAVGNKIFAISGANVAGGGGPHLGLTSNEMLELK